MITLRQIQNEIMFGQFTNQELNDISMAVQYARKELIKQNINSVRIGTQIEFRSSKNGRQVTGEVLKVGRKFLTVREHGMTWANWRVPANMVTVI